VFPADLTLTDPEWSVRYTFPGCWGSPILSNFSVVSPKGFQGKIKSGGGIDLINVVAVGSAVEILYQAMPFGTTLRPGSLYSLPPVQINLGTRCDPDGSFDVTDGSPAINFDVQHTGQSSSNSVCSGRNVYTQSINIGPPRQ
jgi:hypothetical protein